MKTCTKNLPCPTPTWCAAGCYFNEATLTTRNGGNTITDGEPLKKPVYTGNDVIEIDESLYPWGLFVVLVLWLIFGFYVALGVSP